MPGENRVTAPQFGDPVVSCARVDVGEQVFLDGANIQGVHPEIAVAQHPMQYFAVIFLAITLIAGYFSYRVVKDREGAPEPVDALVWRK